MPNIDIGSFTLGFGLGVILYKNYSEYRVMRHDRTKEGIEVQDHTLPK